jgi:thiamine transport system ATP-binding protein
VVKGLAAEQLTVRFGTTTAVDDVSLEVAPGEVLAVLGASGSGKSSLLRAIAGLEPLASGRVSWDGEDLAGLPVHRRGFVVMFQDGQLFPHLSVGGNVGYALHAQPAARRTTRVAELLDLVGLAGYAERPITALSGGEAQRVALARSLAAEPRLLMLDEPLSSLDAGLREHLTGVLDRALEATGTPALYVTHDQDEAFAIADRVAVLSAGRLLQVDAPADLWGRPSGRAVADFLGYGPFLDPADAERLGWPGTPEGTVAVGPSGLVAAPDGTPVPVLAATPFRGGTELAVRLPDGQDAGVRITAMAGHGRPPAEVRVRLDPGGCAVLAT